MSHVLTLRTMYEAARVTLPTYLQSFTNQLTHEQIDEALAAFAQRVVANAKIDIRVEGRDDVPTDETFVYMSNHQSHMDIPVLYATVPAKTLRMVAKKELFRIPLWSRALRVAGMIEVDRQKQSKAIASLDGAVSQLKRGVNIWIAPEGTRSRTGELGQLKKGGFHLARKANVPILPVALSGTRAILPPGTTKTRSGCPVRVVFGDPIAVEGRDIGELLNDVETFLEAHVG